MASNKVIIIDDSEELLRDLRALLENNSYEVIEASDSLKGIEAIKNHQDCALIISDLNMPHMSGLEMLDSLGKENICLEVPKLMLTTDFLTKKPNSDFMNEKGRELGVKAWWIKPIDKEREDHFIEIIKQIIEDS